ncbi:N-acetyl-gamma-glutamyl-phosphate reductase [Hartmannibacter diazotrophicus]|uniref:N-acetyl-gamma-glutamyl-phosphate reductase n=1 Tax=Hartmannibacter diazotrophicus TaxID=1482074 RepID=A0A2C9DCI2_9HYPH|nr:N-acetyl-gamma-glutamyl-phosphate reductase [Hartmannibacter diazotrophicus]SON57315.1 N-acetyl-gamma-glutamyl-phosphate reductase [Hartmannibacter diazotrophicus]
MHKIFIDGEAGTTGLQIRERLSSRSDITLLTIDASERKNPAARARLLNEADVAILCLPDDAARESVSMIENPDTRVIDASTAHRVSDGWEYGFAEMAPGHGETIAASKRVANPGCWPQGLIACVRPLVEASLLPADFPLTYNGISGYSGGGRQMIEDYENASDQVPFIPYGLRLNHKHLPEMKAYAKLEHDPLFQPSVGNFAQGMLTFIPLQLWNLPGHVASTDVHAVLQDRYAGETFVSVGPLSTADKVAGLDPRSLNGTNSMQIHVFGNDMREQVLLAVLYDNLGKGASGAAVQNLNLMIGADPATGLIGHRQSAAA